MYKLNGRVFRTVLGPGLDDMVFCRNSGFFLQAEERGCLIKTKEVADIGILASFPGARMVLEHECVPFITFPYEWTFSQLKKAALLHLDLHLLALKYGVTMRDASAYNIQFENTKPVFIDYLSFARYKEGEIWAGHHQFCEQFLNPLLLFSKAGLEYQTWYKGSLGGISTCDTNRILPWRAKFSPQILTHVVLKDHFDRASLKQSSGAGSETFSPQTGRGEKAKLPQKALETMLSSLRSFIAGLERRTQKTLWEDYSKTNSYTRESNERKRSAVRDFCARRTPRRLLDIGCNSGEFSEISLSSGAGQVVGLDLDHGAVALAFNRAEIKKLALLPLLQDFKNPSPSQGWNGIERQALSERIIEWNPDAILALAVIHHLALSGNIPLDQVVEWLAGIAPCGVIEFVPKEDLTVRIMMRYREDIFPDYTQTVFEECLRRRADIVNRFMLANGRILYEFSR
ncbi:MAG: class I SAM-dependent methyltransferase [Elusimicrobiales bacterium]